MNGGVALLQLRKSKSALPSRLIYIYFISPARKEKTALVHPSFFYCSYMILFDRVSMTLECVLM